MNWFRVKLRLRSWVASAWQSDTLFGHLCWGMRYLYGADELEGFLRLYDEGMPPLLVSNGFPGELLPNPLLPAPGIERTLPLNKQREIFRQRKQTRASRCISLPEFNSAVSGEPIVASPTVAAEGTFRITLKNQLNRLTSTTDAEHPLYSFEERYCPEITVYLKIAADFADTARRLFEYIAGTGYGKRKSAGYGEIQSMSFDTFNGFGSPQGANGFVTLSNFVPAGNDPTRGYWSMFVKYGRMGEEWASEDRAFKKPLLMLEAGSTFLDAPCREHYGCLVKNLNPAYPQAVQYALALPVPIVIPQNVTDL